MSVSFVSRMANTYETKRALNSEFFGKVFPDKESMSARYCLEESYRSDFYKRYFA
jgi:hypothetical protein